MKDLIEGLAILFKYYPSAIIGAEHDQIFVYAWKEKEEVYSQDAKRLGKLGWWVDIDGGWTVYC